VLSPSAHVPESGTVGRSPLVTGPDGRRYVATRELPETAPSPDTGKLPLKESPGGVWVEERDAHGCAIYAILPLPLVPVLAQLQGDKHDCSSRSAHRFRAYVGSAVNVVKRRNRHLRDLGSGKHHSRRLQRIWEKHGPSHLAFVTLERGIDDSQLIAREQYWIDLLKPAFNTLTNAGNSLGLKHRPETLVRMSRARLGNQASKGRELSPEHRSKISLSLLGNQRTKGYRASAFTLQKLRDANKGRVKSEETRAKLRAVMLGKPKSPEHRAALSRVARGRRLSEQTRHKISLANLGRPAPNAGKPASPETRRKIGDAQRGRKRSAACGLKISLALKGRPKSTAHRESIRQSWIRRKASPNYADYCARSSARRKGWKPDSLWRAKMSRTHKGKPKSEAHKAAIKRSLLSRSLKLRPPMP